jgi:Mn2+/Fe2+ NRAMP family transporter
MAVESRPPRVPEPAGPRDGHDPYALSPADAKEPPAGFRGTLRHLGPGMILSAAVVGSGELITTTSLGAKAGFVLLWLVIISYWCLEKGYARWTGPDDGTEERARRAEGWIRVMRADALVAWGVCTLCTLSFYVIGAAVLHPQDLVPEGNEMITTLSRIYTDTLGPWAEYLFLAGAFAVLYSTAIASSASVPRLWTNTLGLLGVLDWSDVRVRERTIRILTLTLPPLWALFFLYLQSPVLMVQIGGVASGIFLVAVVIAVWWLRRTELDPRFRTGRLMNAALVLSTIAITVLGAYTVLEVFGIEIGSGG